MQLVRKAARALRLACAVLVGAGTTRADDELTVKAGAEAGGYADSVGVNVLTPSVNGAVENPLAGWRVDGRYLLDVVSAASPDIVATATKRWSEVRQAGNIGARYKPGDIGGAAYGTFSYSPDYLALVGGGQLLVDLDEKNLSLLGGYAYGNDTIGRAGTSFSTFSRTLAYHTITVGIARPLSASSVFSVTADAIIERGDQSKPYRYIPLFTPSDAAKVPRGVQPDQIAALRIQPRPLEQLPLERERYALAARFATRNSIGTLRLEERGYIDAWGIKASTSDVRYMIDVGRRLIVWPNFRFHVQSAVDFWKRAYTATGVNDIPALRTGDRELGALFSFAAGGGARLALGREGNLDAWVLTTQLVWTWTNFADAIYVTTRYSAFAVLGVEATF